MYKVLLVDDEPDETREMLEIMGCEVVVATNGQEGLQEFMRTEKPFDLVILDIVMPRLDGWGLLLAIRQGNINPHIAIIMLTNAKDELSRIAGLRRGADFFLCKPVSAGSLFAHIEAIIRRVQWSGGSPAIALLGGDDAEYVRQLINNLSNREQELLYYLGQGCSNRQISKQLCISETTVKNHISHILKKLQVSNRTQAAMLAKGLPDQIKARFAWKA